MEQESEEGAGTAEQAAPEEAAATPAAPPSDTGRTGRTGRTRRRLAWGGSVLAAVVALAAFGFREFSPWEHLSGPYGSPPRPLHGVPSHGAQRHGTAMDPVLVAGALVERHDGGVRAVNLRTGATWWGVSRPGRVTVDTVGRVDGRHAAIVWSDRRLTVVDVPTGHRVHADVPDRSYAHLLEDSDVVTSGAEVTGLAGGGSHSLVAVVQRRGVDVYDASSGHRVWSREAPGKCGYDLAGSTGHGPDGFLSLDVDCPLFTPSHGDPVQLDYAYSTLLGAATGRPLPGFAHFADGSLVPVGTDRLLQQQHHGARGLGYRVIDSRTGREVWHVDDKDWFSGAGVGGVVGGDGLVVAETGDRVTAFRAADGKRLWRRAVPTYDKRDQAMLRSPAVVAGQVRVVQVIPGPVQVITFTSTGAVAGRQELPMFEGGGNPWIAGGDYGTLMVRDENTRPGKEPGAYAYLSATH
ncbi:PQQ-binding-like beta-propeller repeat protein [Streptomyces sp. NPDC020362]|uniref:outer membrane protein assembly factor BamB family protein n=1 Tax=unclassified Streptomyces TaxID=2593676 RepID=UPI000AE00827